MGYHYLQTESPEKSSTHTQQMVTNKCWGLKIPKKSPYSHSPSSIIHTPKATKKIIQFYTNIISKKYLKQKTFLFRIWLKRYCRATRSLPSLKCNLCQYIDSAKKRDGKAAVTSDLFCLLKYMRHYSLQNLTHGQGEDLPGDWQIFAGF